MRKRASGDAIFFLRVGKKKGKKQVERRKINLLFCVSLSCLLDMM